MINRSKKLQGLIFGSLLLSVSAEAFDILASYTPMNEQKYKSATNNVGLEIGHYKNSDKKVLVLVGVWLLRNL